MNSDQKITNLEQLLDRIDETASDRDQISLGTIMEAVGSRSFGPLLLVAGLVLIVPGIGDIPGVTTATAVFVLLIAGQLLFRRKHLWLPGWLLKRTVTRDTISKAFRWLRSPARFIDRLLRPRAMMFANHTAVAVACIMVAAVMPAMEVVPFGAIVAGVALTAFALSLIAHDGVLALLAFAATAGTFGLAVYHLM